MSIIRLDTNTISRISKYLDIASVLALRTTCKYIHSVYLFDLGECVWLVSEDDDIHHRQFVSDNYFMKPYTKGVVYSYRRSSIPTRENHTIHDNKAYMSKVIERICNIAPNVFEIYVICYDPEYKGEVFMGSGMWLHNDYAFEIYDKRVLESKCRSLRRMQISFIQKEDDTDNLYSTLLTCRELNKHLNKPWYTTYQASMLSEVAAMKHELTIVNRCSLYKKFVCEE